MNINLWIVTFSILLFNLLTTISCYGKNIEPTLVDKYKQHIGKDKSSKVKTSFALFKESILQRTEGNIFSIYEFLGFSGAGYLDKARFRENFKKKILNVYEQTIKDGGTNAKTILVLGGSVDGLGDGYEIIQELKQAGKIKNLVVAGMISDEAVKYHLEGAEKGWGNVISSHNDVLLLMKTYRKKGKPSWELKDAEGSMSKTIEILLDLGANKRAKRAQMEIFEGGASGF